MSKIDELIAELCPEGVEYKRLVEISNINRSVRVVKAQLSESGEYPVYQNCLIPLGYYTEKNRVAGTPYIISAGAADDIGYSETDFWAADDCLTFEGKENIIDNRFIYHILLWQGKVKSRHLNGLI
jgi:hypothetical protein